MVSQSFVGLGRAQQKALVLIATHNPEIAAAMDLRIELRDGQQV